MPDAQLMCSRLCLDKKRDCIDLHSTDLRLAEGETSEPVLPYTLLWNALHT